LPKGFAAPQNYAAAAMVIYRQASAKLGLIAKPEHYAKPPA
jgi:hypothetical protein